jgi:hypothetical protein
MEKWQMWAAGLLVATSLTASAEDPSELLASWHGEPVMLDSRVVRVPLTSSNGPGCAAILESSADDDLTLMLRGLTSEKEPDVAFSIFITDASRKHTTRGEPGYVADLTFFGLTGLKATSRAASFKIGEVIRALRQNGRVSCPLSVEFVPGGTLAEESHPRIAAIEIWRGRNRGT